MSQTPLRTYRDLDYGQVPSADARNGFFAHSSSSNPFVHLSLQATLQLASATGAGIKCEPLDIIIVGSNDFYTQSRSVRRVPHSRASLSFGGKRC